MITVPMDVLKEFPVRKSKKQKQAFRDALQAYANDLGYQVTVEKGTMGSRNIVIGNPDTARYLVTAHYDTCARLPFPNFITPCNLLLYLLYQLGLLAVIFLAVFTVSFLVTVLARDTLLAFWAAYGVFFLIYGLMIAGPANKTNANDNTSGVVTVLEIAKALPEEYRGRVCYVLFDLEEAGLLGSSSYRSAHRKQTLNQVVLNLDCVGDGDEMMLFPTGKLCKDSEMMEQLSKLCATQERKSLKLHKKGFCVYPSDQASFPYGVGIAAFRRKKGIGLYCSRIHTSKDTVLEIENVHFLRDRLTEWFSGCAAQ